GEMTRYFAAAVQERTAKPGDDLISYLVHARPNGTPTTTDHVLGSLRLLLIAGIDTTWSGIGSCIWHLAKTPQDRRRLVAEPALRPAAGGERIRADGPGVTGGAVVPHQ